MLNRHENRNRKWKWEKHRNKKTTEKTGSNLLRKAIRPTACSIYKHAHRAFTHLCIGVAWWMMVCHHTTILCEYLEGWLLSCWNNTLKEKMPDIYFHFHYNSITRRSATSRTKGERNSVWVWVSKRRWWRWWWCKTFYSYLLKHSCCQFKRRCSPSACAIPQLFAVWKWDLLK